MKTYKIQKGQLITIEGFPAFATENTEVEFHPDNISLLTASAQDSLILKSALHEAKSTIGKVYEALANLSDEWRKIAECERDFCRLQERSGNRNKADRHYQRSLDLAACAAAIDRLFANPIMIESLASPSKSQSLLSRDT